MSKFYPFFMAGLAVLCVALYLHFYFLGAVINFNEYWLYTCSARILNGDRMSVGCYDSNPPLSVLLYVPVVALNKFLSVPVNIGLLIYSLIALSLSVLLSHFMLVRAGIADDKQRILFLFSYFIANVMISGLFFGERDQFVLFGLVPFVFTQIVITQRKNRNDCFEFVLLFLCTFFMLIKPHYGLIPFILVLHRFITHKARISDVLKWRDVQAAALAAVFYGLLIVFYFQDFFSEIVMTSLKFYVLSHREFSLYDVFSMLLIINVSIVSLYFFMVEKLKPNGFIILLCGVSFLALFPYLLQFKGTPYQSIPPKVLLVCAGIQVLLAGLHKQRFEKISLGFCGVVVVGFCAVFMPLNSKTPTHHIYENHPLTHIIKQNKSSDGSCDFFVFESMKAAQIFSYYAQCNLASRFPVLWFFPTLLAEEDKNKTQQAGLFSDEDILFYKKKFAALVTDDLVRYQPKTIIFAENFSFVPSGDLFSLEKFLLEYDPRFQEFWVQYHLQERIAAAFPDIMAGTTLEETEKQQTYAVYVRE